MQFLVLALIGVYVLGGTRAGPVVLRHPMIIGLLAVVIATAFYSLRVAQ